MNEDVVEEIVLRLPAQTLMRCKCVCKKWRDMIQSCDFVNQRRHNRRIFMVNYLEYVMYTHRDLSYGKNYGKNFLSCYDNYDEFLTGCVDDDVEISSDFSHTGWVKLATHSNGIICMTDYQDSSSIILFNPSLRQFRIVPPCPFICPDPRFCPCPDPKPYDHSFDPDALYAVGFGFDESIKKYKVVRMVFLSFYTDIEAQIYDGCWRKSNRVHIGNIQCNCLPLCSPIFFNGILHYMVRTTGTIDDDRLVSFADKIITFNITTELFEIMEFPHNWEYYPIPPEENLMPFNSSILAMDESTLALVAFNYYPWHYESSCCSQLHVWVMKEYGVRESWMKQYSIMWAPPDTRRIGKPLSFLNRDKLLIVTADGMLICCNLVTGEERHLRQYRFPDTEFSGRHPDSGEYYNKVAVPEDVIRTFGVVICDESLVPI